MTGHKSRIALSLAGIVAVGMVAALIIAGNRMSQLTRELLLEIGPPATGTAWNLGRVELVLLAGHGELQGLVIGNPDQYYAGHAIRIAEASFDVALTSLFDQVLVIEEVDIDGADLIYEQHGFGRSNLQRIVDNVRAYSNSAAKADAAGLGPPQAFTIRRLSFTRATVSIRSELFGERRVEVPPVIVTDVGGHSGRAALANALDQILSPIVAEAIAAARAAAVEAGKQRVKEKVDEALDELFDERRDEPRKP